MPVPLVPILVGGGLVLASTLPNTFAWKLHLEPETYTICGGIDRRNLAAKIEILRTRLSIPKPIAFKESTSAESLQAQGTVLFPGAAGIVYNPALLAQFSEAEWEFFLAHELCHIRSNDQLLFGLCASAIAIVTTVAISILFPSFALLTAFSIKTTTFGIGLIAKVIISRWREICADKQAFAVCSPEAQNGAISAFEKWRNAHIEARNDETVPYIVQIWRKLTTSSEGNYRLDLLHPSFTTRISYLSELREPAVASS